MVSVIERLYREMTRRSLRQAYGVHRWQEGIADAVLAIVNAALRDLDIETRLKESQGKKIPVRLQSIRREMLAMRSEMVKAIKERMASLAEGAAANLAEIHAKGVQDSIFDTFALNFSMSRPAPATLEAIALSRPFQGRVMAEHVVKLGDDFVARATRALQVGMANGRTPQELAGLLRGNRRRGVEDPSAVYPVTRRESQVISRTFAQHVHSEARGALYEANGNAIGNVMYVCTLDERTCILYCAPRDGLMWTLPDHKPVNHDLPWLGGPGQIHFQCRCTSIPVFKSGFLEDLGVDPAKLAQGGRAAMDGPVDVATDYSDWLKKQPPSRQDLILGAKRAEWWRRSGKSLLQATEHRFGKKPIQPARTLADAFDEFD
jgi:hypothetical protein